jgi:hypothetical protein
LQELLDHRLVLEVFDVAGYVVHEAAHLVPDRSRGPDHEHGDDSEEREEDEQRRLAAADAAPGQPGDQRVEPQGEDEGQPDREEDLVGDDHDVGRPARSARP